MKVAVLSALRCELSSIAASDALHRVLSPSDETHVLDVAKADIGACVGCSGCWRSGRCVHSDDMSQFLPHVAETDLLVLATPIVFGVHHPLLKKAVDRLLPLGGGTFAVRNREMHHHPRYDKRYALLGIGWSNEGGPPDEAETFERLIGRHAVNLACPRHAAVVLRQQDDVEDALRHAMQRLEVPR